LTLLSDLQIISGIEDGSLSVHKTATRYYQTMKLFCPRGRPQSTYRKRFFKWKFQAGL